MLLENGTSEIGVVGHSEQKPCQCRRSAWNQGLTVAGRALAARGV